MNLNKLKIAEAHFLQSYPDGFADAALAEIGKKHRVDGVSGEPWNESREVTQSLFGQDL